jgi:hypothetical protein
MEIPYFLLGAKCVMKLEVLSYQKLQMLVLPDNIMLPDSLLNSNRKPPNGGFSFSQYNFTTCTHTDSDKYETDPKATK